MDRIDQSKPQPTTVRARRFECLGPAGSVVRTNSMAEALFWQVLGYFVRYAGRPST